MRIHAIDIVQLPGIGMPPIADMDPHQTTVTAALAAKRSAETPTNACREARSAGRGGPGERAPGDGSFCSSSATGTGVTSR
jgi:hypothetical protein